eukprot:4672713-Lingulodinium_polyedra.AAC.1
MATHTLLNTSNARAIHVQFSASPWALTQSDFPTQACSGTLQYMATTSWPNHGQCVAYSADIHKQRVNDS